MNDARFLAEAGAHQVVSLFVIDYSGTHSAHDREVIHLLGDVREVFAEVNACGGDQKQRRESSKGRESWQVFQS
jgi:hypothetical protein